MSELPLSTAKEYLQEHNIPVDPEIHELLSMIPLHFSNLGYFCAKWNRNKEEAKKFVGYSFVNQESVLSAAINKHPDSVKIYQTAVKNGRVTMNDLIQLSISVEQFEKLFVHSNIFFEQEDGCYKFQFRATKKAAEDLLKKN